MFKRSVIFSLLLMLAVAGWAQSGQQGWSKYSNDAGKFSMFVPGTPEETSSTAKGVLLHTFKVLQRPRLYLVIYSDYPDADLELKTAARLAAEKDGFLKGLSNGKLISEREITFKRGNTDLPALEFTAETDSVNYKSVVVLDGRRVYFACAGSIKGNDSTSEFERFLGSFTLD
jgi:hypothetical protein